MTIIVTELKYVKTAKPMVLGADMRQYFAEIFTFIKSTRIPCDFVGDPGTGKTHLGRELAMQYARTIGCPAYYLTIDEEMMKASVIAGKAYSNGELKTY